MEKGWIDYFLKGIAQMGYKNCSGEEELEVMNTVAGTLPGRSLIVPSIYYSYLVPTRCSIYKSNNCQHLIVQH